MKKWLTFGKALALSTAIVALPSMGQSDGVQLEGMPGGSGSHDDLVALYQEFLEFSDPERASGDRPNRDIAGRPAEVYPDYGEAAVDQRRETMRSLQDRLEDMAVRRLGSAPAGGLPGREIAIRSVRFHAERIPTLVPRSGILCGPDAAHHVCGPAAVRGGDRRTGHPAAGYFPAHRAGRNESDGGRGGFMRISRSST